LLSTTKADTSVIKLMNRIAKEFIESSPDSTLKYATEARRLSEESNYPEGEISSILNMSDAFTVTGNYSKGLTYALDGLKRSEALRNQKLITSSLWSVGYVYAFQEDNQQALIYRFKILESFRNKPINNSFAGALLNIGATYINMGELDSSRLYFDRSLNAATQVNDHNIIAAAQMNIGRIFLKHGQYDTANIYFRKAMPTFVKDNNHLFIYSNAYFLAESFDSTRQYDSALYYSQLSLHHAKAMKSLVTVSEITKQLSSLYKQKGQPDSALFFMDMAMTARDSLNTQENGTWSYQVLPSLFRCFYWLYF